MLVLIGATPEGKKDRLPLADSSVITEGREVRRVLPQQGGEHLLEVAGRHPTKVENRNSASRLFVAAPTSAGSTR
jgi:hypothetical protein